MLSITDVQVKVILMLFSYYSDKSSKDPYQATVGWLLRLNHSLKSVPLEIMNSERGSKMLLEYLIDVIEQQKEIAE